MNYKISETIYYFRVDIDEPNSLNQLADYIDKSGGFEATQTVHNIKLKQAYVMCRSIVPVFPQTLEDAKNKLSEIVKNFN